MNLSLDPVSKIWTDPDVFIRSDPNPVFKMRSNPDLNPDPVFKIWTDPDRA